MTAGAGLQGSHLREAEYVDLLEGTLPAPRTDHVSGCETCRATADAVRATYRDAAGGDVPEPPPFFWAQLSARVRDAVANEPVPRARFWPVGRPRAMWWGALATAAAVILAVGLWRASPPDGASAPGTTGATTADSAIVEEALTPLAPLNDVELDEDWALVRSVADDLPADAIAAAGIGARLGAAEGLALRLTDAERRELARLLEDEISRAASPESSS